MARNSEIVHWCNAFVPRNLSETNVPKSGEKFNLPKIKVCDAGCVELCDAFKIDVFKIDVFIAGVCLYRSGLFETWDIKKEHGKLMKM